MRRKSIERSTKISVAMTATLAKPYRSGTGAGKGGNIPSSHPRASANASMTAERVRRRTDTVLPCSRDKIDILPFRQLCRTLNHDEKTVRHTGGEVSRSLDPPRFDTDAIGTIGRHKRDRLIGELTYDDRRLYVKSKLPLLSWHQFHDFKQLSVMVNLGDALR